MLFSSRWLVSKTKKTPMDIIVKYQHQNSIHPDDKGPRWGERLAKSSRLYPQACYFTVLRPHLSIAETVNTIRNPDYFCPYGGKKSQ